MKKPAAKKPTRKTLVKAPSAKALLQEQKTNKAFQVAAEAMLFMHTDKKPVYLRALPEAPFYEADFSAEDFRFFVATRIAGIAERFMREMHTVSAQEIYDTLLLVSDPHHYLDRLTEEEFRTLIAGTVYILTLNYYVVDSIAKQLLELAPDEQNVLVCHPEFYKMA